MLCLSMQSHMPSVAERKREEKSTLFSDHNKSLLQRQPRAAFSGREMSHATGGSLHVISMQYLCDTKRSRIYMSRAKDACLAGVVMYLKSQQHYRFAAFQWLGRKQGLLLSSAQLVSLMPTTDGGRARHLWHYPALNTCKGIAIHTC